MQKSLRANCKCAASAWTGEGLR